MKNAYLRKYVSSRGYYAKSFLKLTAIFLLVISGTNAWGQVSSYSFTTSASAVLDPMASSTQLLGSASDDGVSAVTPIGFTFNYAGINYTQFSVNANGLLRLGATAVADSWNNSSANAGTNSPAIMPYWDDLATGTNGKVHYILSGAAPNRKLTIEWNVTVPRATGGAANAKFQCVLTETSNTVYFAYGAGMLANTDNSGATIGLATSSTVYNVVNATANTNSSSTYTNTNTVAIASGRSYLFTPPSCFAPSALTATAITPTSTNISWTAPASAPASGYEYEVRTSGAAGSGATGLVQSGSTAAGVTTKAISSLTTATAYNVYVRSNCGSGDFSGWTAATAFTTGCKLPTAIVSSAVTTNSATIAWTASQSTPGSGYEYEIRTSGAAGSGATGLAASGTTAAGVVTANVTGLIPGTTYMIYVRSSCGSGEFSAWTSSVSFITVCVTEMAPTVQQTFATATGASPANCWSEATGALAAASTLTTGNSEWLASTGFANTGTNKGIKTNLYSAGNEWFISNEIDLGTTTDFRLKYDMAVTSYDGTVAQTTLGTHKVNVVISTDGGLTWTNANILKTYTGAAGGTGVTYSATGVTETISLAAYTGVIKIAFVATTTDLAPDIDFHIDNFVVEEIPGCLEPIAPMASASTATTGTISWSAPTPEPANGYEYEIRTSGAAGSGATGLTTSGTTAMGILTKNITGLTANTSYSVYVRSNCSGGSLSVWVGPVTLFTGYCAPAPSSVDGIGIINVAVGTINNPSVAEINNYGDYSLMSTDLVIGAPDTVKVTYSTGFGYSYGTKIWIDFNDDLDFTDAGELIYTGLSTAAVPTTLKANILIPIGATQGMHRMRIGGTDTDTGPDNACYTGTYGTFEDYTVNVVCPVAIAAPTAPVGDIVCVTEMADLSVTGLNNATLTWYDAATAGAVVNSDATFTTGALATTTSYWVEQSYTGCPAVSSRVEVVATVVPVNLTLTAVNNTCNGYAAGSFALGTVTCGTAPFEYSVNGGAFGPIPTNLAAGTYSVIVRDVAMGLSQPISVVVTQPAFVVPTPTVANADACAGATSEVVNATTPMVPAAPMVLSFNVSGQPTETNASPGNILASATMAALPAGAVVTSVTLSVPVITPLGNSWKSDVRLGASGAIVNAAASGTGAGDEGGVFNYTRVLPNNSVDVAGGTVNILYWDNYNDITTGPDAAFTTGTGAATMTIQYNVPTTVTWWTASTGGTQLGSALTLETVGTSVLASPAAVGTYNFYAQTETGTCTSVTRAPLVVTVHALPTPTITSPSLEFCAGENLVLTSSAATSYAWSTTATANTITVSTPGSYTVTVTDANGCVGTSAAVVVIENALPVVDAGTAQTVCENSMVTLVGSGAVSYAWNNSVTNNTPFSIAATTTYTVTGTDANGCEGTDNVTVTVNQNPEPVITGDLAFCAGDSTLLVASSLTGNVWSTTQANDSIYVDAAGSYTVTETDVNGCVGTSAPAVVTMNALPMINGGADIAVCKNGQAILFATGGQSYDWTGNITNGVSFVATTTTTYTVTGTDANGCSNTDAVVVTVNPLPSVEAGMNQTLCGAGQVTLTATGATVYSWNNNVVNGTAFTAPVGTNVYMVTGIDALGCSNTDVVTVTVNPLPVASATAANQLTIVASPAGMSYQWINCTTNQPILGENNQTLTASANGSYKVIVTGMGGCADTSACVNITSVGVEENTADLGVTLYPNPTGGDVYVNMPASVQANITVYDAQGKVVSVMNNVQNGAVIDLKNVEMGMYMIQVANASGSDIFRVVKN